ncbi:MAG: type II/IV secretion system protein [Proteobacteria bacterium]|nr:type II/IV secretion system protein [Pseudomonadota bacterium]
MSAVLDVFSEHGVPAVDLEKARSYQARHGGRLDQILVNMGSLPSEDLPAIYSKWFGAPVLSEADWRDWQLPEGSDALPLEFLLVHGWLPWERHEDSWVFASCSPFDLEVNAWLAEHASRPELRLLSSDDFEVLRARLGLDKSDLQLDGLSLVEEDRLRELASEAPTVNLLNSLIAKALRRGASDMHIEPHAGRARVRFRIDGVLHEIESIPAAMMLPVITRLKILAAMDIAERRRPQDGKIELRIGGEEVDIRVSALPLHEGGESAVLRFLRKAALIDDMSLLGLSPDIEASILEDLEVTSGVILLTGPTGSGKTTSLYTFISRINSPEVKIITLEDPVEYQLTGVNQVQVQPEIGFDFARGLRSIVRQDPDIIMVGEIRDRETASVAMQSALTGHLVFSTVHTSDAPSAFTRLLDLGVEEFLLNAALRSIVAQRLVRRLCACSKAHPDAEQLMARYQLAALAERSGLAQPNLRQSVGCDDCGQTGYRGRLAIVEYLRCDDAIAAMDKGERFIAEAREHMRTLGGRSLIEDGLLKALSGDTTVEEVFRVAG